MRSTGDILFILVAGLVLALLGAALALPAILLARWRRKRGASTPEYCAWYMLGVIAPILILAVVGFVMGAQVGDELAGDVAIMLATAGAVGGGVGAIIPTIISAILSPKMP